MRFIQGASPFEELKVDHNRSSLLWQGKLKPEVARYPEFRANGQLTLDHAVIGARVSPLTWVGQFWFHPGETNMVAFSSPLQAENSTLLRQTHDRLTQATQPSYHVKVLSTGG